MATRQVIVYPAQEVGYWVEVPGFRGCFSQGDTKEDALENIKEAITLHIEDMIANGEDIPDETGGISVEKAPM